MTTSKTETFAIVGLTADPIKGEKNLQNLVSQLKVFCEILMVSSVYKRDSDDYLNPQLGRWNKTSELVVAVKIKTSLVCQDLLSRISTVRVVEGGVVSRANLLAVDHEILLTPGSTLPEPQLAQDRLILQCAAEVWADYQHPILLKTLSELVKTHPMTDPIEFFSQGNYLY